MEGLCSLSISAPRFHLVNFLNTVLGHSLARAKAALPARVKNNLHGTSAVMRSTWACVRRCTKAEAAAERKPSARELEAAPAAAQELLEGLLESLSIADADAAEGKARRILRGLGFASRQTDGPVSQLSGG